MQLRAGLGGQQELLSDGPIFDADVDVEVVVRGRIQILEIDRRFLAVLGIGGQVGEAEVGLDRALVGIGGVGERHRRAGVERNLARLGLIGSGRERAAGSVAIDIGVGQEQRGVVGFGVAVAQQDRNVVRDLELQPGANRPVLVGADLLVVIDGVGEVAVALAQLAFDIERDPVAEAEGGVTLVGLGVEPAIAGLDLGRGRGAGIGGRHQDRAARGVAAKQRALRALQDLNALDVGQVKGGRFRVGDKEAIHIDADIRAAARGGDGGADAADGRLGEAARAVETQGGRQARNVRQLDHVRGFQLRGADRGDRDRNVTGPFVAALGRDDDFGHRALRVGRLSARDGGRDA